MPQAWLFGPAIDDVGQAWISSGSAGTMCPCSMRLAGTIILVRIVGSTGKMMLGMGTSDMMISLLRVSGKKLKDRDINLRRKKVIKFVLFISNYNTN